MITLEEKHIISSESSQMLSVASLTVLEPNKCIEKAHSLLLVLQTNYTNSMPHSVDRFLDLTFNKGTMD